MSEIVNGPGYARRGPRAARRGLRLPQDPQRGSTSRQLGVNAIVMPPGLRDGRRTTTTSRRSCTSCTAAGSRSRFGDGTTHELGAGGLARVDAPTVRAIDERRRGRRGVRDRRRRRAATWCATGARAEGLSAEDAPPARGTSRREPALDQRAPGRRAPGSAPPPRPAAAALHRRARASCALEIRGVRRARAARPHAAEWEEARVVPQRGLREAGASWATSA